MMELGAPANGPSPKPNCLARSRGITMWIVFPQILLAWDWPVGISGFGVLAAQEVIPVLATMSKTITKDKMAFFIFFLLFVLFFGPPPDVKELIIIYHKL